MNITETQLDLLVGAWATSRDGNGVVLEDHAIPDAHDLCEGGWLERYFRGDQLCWRWSRQAEAALDVSRLLSTAASAVN